MNILVTGAKGFVGKNLIAELHNRGYDDVLEYDCEDSWDLLDEYCKKAEFVFHLAGVNRPQNQDEYMKGNFGFTQILLKMLKKHMNFSTIIFSSSIQAVLDNPYGISKKATEDLLCQYKNETSASIKIYRFQNIFGKWCKPNYNSVIATFCYNITRDLSININEPDKVMNFIYIDDVIDELINTLNRTVTEEFNTISPVYNISLKELKELIMSFKNIRNDNMIPNMRDEFTKKLYSTYLSYLPEEQFSYELKMNEDSRGSFTEFIKTPDRGQISINIVKSGAVKGNHWHHTKNEKFIVVKGKGIIQLRRIDDKKIIEYFVSDEKLEVIDIPVGYTHKIINNSKMDLTTLIWVNEIYKSDLPDTYILEV